MLAAKGQAGPDSKAGGLSLAHCLAQCSPDGMGQQLGSSPSSSQPAAGRPALQSHAALKVDRMPHRASAADVRRCGRHRVGGDSLRLADGRGAGLHDNLDRVCRGRGCRRGTNQCQGGKRWQCIVQGTSWDALGCTKSSKARQALLLTPSLAYTIRNWLGNANHADCKGFPGPRSKAKPYLPLPSPLPERPPGRCRRSGIGVPPCHLTPCSLRWQQPWRWRRTWSQPGTRPACQGRQEARRGPWCVSQAWRAGLYQYPPSWLASLMMQGSSVLCILCSPAKAWA